jgi:uncharacterized membrane protein YqjE
MLPILFCLLLSLLPDAASLAALVQMHATILAFAVFAFILCHWRLGGRAKSAIPPQSAR